MLDVQHPQFAVQPPLLLPSQLYLLDVQHLLFTAQSLQLTDQPPLLLIHPFLFNVPHPQLGVQPPLLLPVQLDLLDVQHLLFIAQSLPLTNQPPLLSIQIPAFPDQCTKVMIAVQTYLLTVYRKTTLFASERLDFHFH